MTKAKFFDHCRRHDTTQGVRFEVDQRREYRGMDNILVLHGYWAKGAISEVELYRPWPGRQWHCKGGYEECHKKLDAAEKKFKRWLEEWKSATGK